jgi:hypothetical protein
VFHLASIEQIREIVTVWESDRFALEGLDRWKRNALQSLLDHRILTDDDRPAFRYLLKLLEHERIAGSARVFHSKAEVHRVAIHALHRNITAIIQAINTSSTSATPITRHELGDSKAMVTLPIRSHNERILATLPVGVFVSEDKQTHA